MKSTLLNLYLVLRPVLFVTYCVVWACIQLLLLPFIVLGALTAGVVSGLIAAHQESKEANHP